MGLYMVILLGKSGRRPRARGMPGGPSVVTEGYLRAYARQPARGVEVGGWRVEDWVRVQAEGLGGLGAMLRTAWVYLGHLEPLLRGLGAMGPSWAHVGSA